MSQHPVAPRCVALLGPQGAGKTTLLESLLFEMGALGRKGRVSDHTTVGDTTPEAKAHNTSTETTIATADHMGERWTLLDAPGSVEFSLEARQVALAADAVVVVCEPSPERAATLGPVLRFLDTWRIPHLLFVNKAKGMQVRVKDLLGALQAASARPLVLREVPIRQDDKVMGVVDVVSERAWAFSGGKESTRLVSIPSSAKALEEEARAALVEHLAELDDTLMAEFLDDVTPTPAELWENLERDFAQDLVVPVFLGEALTDEGVDRLLKALRHEVPGPHVGAARLGLDVSGEPAAYVFKTQFVSHTGKVSWARVWRGAFEDGQTLSVGRVSGLYTGFGAKLNKIEAAGMGEVVAVGKLDGVGTGTWLTPTGSAPAPALDLGRPRPVYTRGVRCEKRTDDVKLPAAMARMQEEDPSLVYEHDGETNQTVIGGQGAIHLAVAGERLASRFGVPVVLDPPRVPYKETIKAATKQHGRHKRQTGGHGQFADVHLEVAPLGRGEGFHFVDRIVGGAVPRQFIPAVEAGSRDALREGPLGFPVVDVQVTLTDGSHHAVDSSDQAFHTAASQTVREALGRCEPTLLEPFVRVEVQVPADFTAPAQRLLTGRRGQLLGYDALDGHDGWDVVRGLVPQREMAELIIELRSQTLGLGTYTAWFDHYQELAGRLADQVVAEGRKGG